MLNFSDHPIPNYVPNKIAAGCFAGLSSISLIAWIIQSYQTRFNPRRLSFLLLISHLAICIELIVRAAVNSHAENSTIILIIFASLMAIGQRMIIVANFSFVLEIHHEKSPFSRFIFIGAILCVITSGILMVLANTSSYDADHINTIFLYRQLSASILLFVTIIFYPILYWSKTIKDMTIQARCLIFLSSLLCLITTCFLLIQSSSIDYYYKINSQEIWFYAFQILPIILAHCLWSIFHPKRSIRSYYTLT